MSKKAKIIITIVVVIVFISLIWQNVVRQPEVISTDPIKIGLIAPLSGGAASWGQNVLAGVSLAVKEINDSNGFKGKKIELVVEDDQCNPGLGISSVNKLIQIDNVSGVLAVCAASAGAILPIVQENNISTILVLASTPHFTKLGDYIFRVNASDSNQAEFAADFIYNKLRKTRVAVVYVKNESGQGMKDFFTEEFISLGGEIVYVSGVSQEEKDLRTEIAKIKDIKADTLFFPVYPVNAVSGLKQIKEMNLEIPVVGYAPFGGVEIVESGYAEGVMFTTPKIGLTEEFGKLVNSLPGFENLKIQFSSSLGYDATKVLYSAIEQGGGSSEKTKKALAKTSYSGISNPLIQFDVNGDILNPIFEMKMIKDKKVVDY